MKQFLLAATLLTLCSLYISAQNVDLSLLEKAEIPYIFGESKMIIHPKPESERNEKKWFTNDHCFVIDNDSTLHWFGINNPFPPEGKELYRYHPYIGHFTTKEPTGDWKRLAYALDESKGTEYWSTLCNLA